MGKAWLVNDHMEIIACCSCVSTTVWLHHIDFNKTHERKPK